MQKPHSHSGLLCQMKEIMWNSFGPHDSRLQLNLQFTREKNSILIIVFGGTILGVFMNIPVMETSSVNATLTASSVPNRIDNRFFCRLISRFSATTPTL